MRDIVLATFLIGSIPFVLWRPVIGVFLWIWVSVMSPHRLTWGFAYDFRWAYLIAVATLAGLLLSKAPKRLPVTPVTVVLALMVVWMTVSTYFAIDVTLSLGMWERVIKIIFMVFVVHFSFFMMLPVLRANLYFALAALFSVIASMTQNYYYFGASPDQKFFLAVITSVFFASHQIFMFTSIYSYVKLRTKLSFWILVALESFGIILAALWYRIGSEYLLAWMPLICYLFIIFISVVAQKRQVKEARMLTIGFVIASASYLTFLIIARIDTSPNFLVPLFNFRSFLFLIYTLAPPAAVSIFRGGRSGLSAKPP
jgi:hypothetical protein